MRNKLLLTEESPLTKTFRFFLLLISANSIIDQCIKRFLDKLYVPKQIVPTVSKRELVVVLPLLGTFFLNLRKRYKSFSKSLPQCNIEVIFQSKNRLSSLFKFKVSIPLYLWSHLIYKFQCSNCNITYYDETEGHLKVRAGEHISKSPLRGKRVDNNRKSSVKGKIMQTEKALINDSLCVWKVSWKFHIPTIYNFPVIYPWNLLFS